MYSAGLYASTRSFDALLFDNAEGAEGFHDPLKSIFKSFFIILNFNKDIINVSFHL